MGMLGDFLEAVYGSAEPFHSVQATIRHWRDRYVAEQAYGGNRTVMGRRKSPSNEKQRIEQTNLSVWIVPPRKLRIEKERQYDDRVETSLIVVNGQEWWRRDHEGHVEIASGHRDSSPGSTDVNRHFDRRSLREYFVPLNLEYIGKVRTAEHDCVRLRAVPRGDGRLWPHWLPFGAEEYEFHAEPRRGLLFSIIGLHGGKPFEVNEVTQAAFDQPLDDTLFTYTPAFGEQVRPEEKICERLTLESAVERMLFVVLVPSQLPDSEEAPLCVVYHPPRLRSPRSSLMIGYPTFHLSESNSADPEWDRLEWEALERNGKSLRISDPGEGHRIVALEQEGTHVSIWSEMDREPLLDLAATLIPARRNPQ